MPKYNVNNIPDGFEVRRKNRPLNLIESQKNCGLKLEILLEKNEKKQKEVKRKEKSRWMTEKTLKIVKKSGRRQK